MGAHRDIASDQRRRRAHSIQRILCLVAVALFVLPLFVLGVTSLVDQDKTVSEKENRNLKTRPAFTLQALFDGSFTKDFEEYYADTFPLRDFSYLSTRSSAAFYAGRGQERFGAD